MAGINIRELYFRVTSRPEILPGALRSALMDAGIVVCRESNLLKQTVFATLKPGASKLTIPAPPNHEITRVDQVFYRDPTSSTGEWMEVKEIAPVYLERQRLAADSMPQEAPSFWGLRGSTLFLQAPADATYPLRIVYCWAPTRASQPETFDLPGDAEDTIIAYARWILLQDLDPKAADKAKSAFDDGLSGLRGMGETGESGNRSVLDFLPFEG